jgi:hypothetical protein
VNNQEIFYENSSTLSNQIPDKNNGDIDLDRSCQQGFFTLHNTTVEVLLENDTLSWSTVTGESHDETSRRKPTNRDTINSVNLQDVYAISPIYTHHTWSSNINENIAGTTVSTANTFSSSVLPPSSTLSETSTLRGFQLHSYQTMPENILQEILIIFQSNDSNQIERWYHLLSKIIYECNENFKYNEKFFIFFFSDKQTRHIFVICNPYAGGKHSRHTYNTKIKPMLERAQYKVTYTGKYEENLCHIFEEYLFRNWRTM